MTGDYEKEMVPTFVKNEQDVICCQPLKSYVHHLEPIYGISSGTFDSQGPQQTILTFVSVPGPTTITISEHCIVSFLNDPRGKHMEGLTK